MKNPNLSADQAALFDAIDSNDINTAQSLIEKLTPEELSCFKSSFNQTPLHLALRIHTVNSLRCDDSIAILLINKLSSEQLNIPDINRDTPLAYAFNSGTDRCIELLMSKLTEYQLLDKQNKILVCRANFGGQTFEDIARSFDRHNFADKIADLRRKYEIETEVMCLRASIESGNLEWAAHLIETSSNEALDTKDKEGNTPLHFFAMQRSTDISTLFLLLTKLPKKALVANNKNSISPNDAAIISKNHLTASAISTVYGILQHHAEDTSLENLLGKELAKEVFDKLFCRSKEQLSEERS